jgi:hypothetical protein
MSCIIFKLGRDAHMNIIKLTYKNHVNVLVIYLALPPQLYERVDK